VLIRLFIKANTVYRIGSYEYSLQWRDAPESAQYAALKFGAWMLELKGHLQDKISGKSKVLTLLSFPTQIP
jgi:acid phosphatase